MMNQFDYIKQHYAVPAAIGRLVKVNGRSGVIVKDCGHHLGVNFDDDKPGVISHCHPTWEVEYGEIGNIRKQTKSQQRYQRYLEYGDRFENFIDYCHWDASKNRSWNGGAA
ncbi:hypothetical protein [Shewanella baltica]|uniref:hypothetical protein n=1 Tax=Shewanella baltica TaxID=62322 RepID=UPI00217EA22E|nr:hypothetical protein [Shewanella baltica]